MAIISVSLKDDFLEEVNVIQKELGFSGRSELIRAGLRMIIADNKDKKKLNKMGKLAKTLHQPKAVEKMTEALINLAEK